MSDQPDDVLTNHEYDGIQEYDNPLPMWWMWTFFATVIFGFLYWLHYSFGGAPTQKAQLATDLAAIHAMEKESAGATLGDDDLKKLANPEFVQKGKAVFAAKCAVCHGPQLQGLIGPNLTDDFWLHGRGTPADILKIVTDGIPDMGMPTWGTQLAKEELESVALFVAAQHGTNPPNPKAPQGERVGQ